MTKKMRQQIILNVINTKKVRNLSELLQEVTKQGCKVNLSTLSRDLTETGIVKTPDGYRFMSDKNDAVEILPSQVTTLQQMIKGMKAVKNMVVVQTTTGGAQVVARWLDLVPNSGLVGTVAGDDTIMGLAETNTDANKFIKWLSNTIENRKLLKMDSFMIRK